MRILQTAEDMQKTGERIHYLSLALDARLAIKALRAAAKSQATPAEVADTIRAAVDSLKAIDSPDELYAKLADRAPYEHFEQIQTLQEVRSTLQDQNVIARLESLIRAKPMRSGDLEFAIAFFSDVEARALHYYNDPHLPETYA